uniref:Uncharacterized protein n=1 Tax=Chromera velia CCMP2878 TaxID=1169474 RepID=A0A0G4FTM8_9ALVE|eukprot:Cvel_3748.t1-p1 / transcript=Cvel_3748.t1 / gene=Cvel_3748 / organism=Chromera_velia_CCMP2878 / gene_product=hypothetical protein / transcript_product=hypothetical protein / location=Cvel_scaffold156:98106-101963(+) / protein_length=1170 / sequence_SO=supercontig / SO=protein_coding / is_pseudo=false
MSFPFVIFEIDLSVDTGGPCRSTVALRAARGVSGLSEGREGARKFFTGKLHEWLEKTGEGSTESVVSETAESAFGGLFTGTLVELFNFLYTYGEFFFSVHCHTPVNPSIPTSSSATPTQSRALLTFPFCDVLDEHADLSGPSYSSVAELEHEGGRRMRVSIRMSELQGGTALRSNARLLPVAFKRLEEGRRETRLGAFGQGVFVLALRWASSTQDVQSGRVDASGDCLTVEWKGLRLGVGRTWEDCGCVSLPLCESWEESLALLEMSSDDWTCRAFSSPHHTVPVPPKSPLKATQQEVVLPLDLEPLLSSLSRFVETFRGDPNSSQSSALDPPMGSGVRAFLTTAAPIRSSGTAFHLEARLSCVPVSVEGDARGDHSPPRTQSIVPVAPSRSPPRRTSERVNSEGEREGGRQPSATEKERGQRGKRKDVGDTQMSHTGRPNVLRHTRSPSTGLIQRPKTASLTKGGKKEKNMEGIGQTQRLRESSLGRELESDGVPAAWLAVLSGGESGDDGIEGVGPSGFRKCRLSLDLRVLKMNVLKREGEGDSGTGLTVLPSVYIEVDLASLGHPRPLCTSPSFRLERDRETYIPNGFVSLGMDMEYGGEACEDFLSRIEAGGPIGIRVCDAVSRLPIGVCSLFPSPVLSAPEREVEAEAEEGNTARPRRCVVQTESASLPVFLPDAQEKEGGEGTGHSEADSVGVLWVSLFWERERAPPPVSRREREAASVALERWKKQEMSRFRAKLSSLEASKKEETEKAVAEAARESREGFRQKSLAVVRLESALRRKLKEVKEAAESLESQKTALARQSEDCRVAVRRAEEQAAVDARRAGEDAGRVAAREAERAEEMAGRLRALEERAVRAESEVADLKAENAVLRAGSGAYSNDVVRLRERVQEETARSESLQATVSRLRSDLSASISENGQLRRQVGEVEVELRREREKVLSLGSLSLGLPPGSPPPAGVVVSQGADALATRGRAGVTSGEHATSLLERLGEMRSVLASLEKSYGTRQTQIVSGGAAANPSDQAVAAGVSTTQTLPDKVLHPSDTAPLPPVRNQPRTVPKGTGRVSSLAEQEEGRERGDLYREGEAHSVQTDADRENIPPSFIPSRIPAPPAVGETGRAAAWSDREPAAPVDVSVRERRREGDQAAVPLPLVQEEGTLRPLYRAEVYRE